MIAIFTPNPNTPSGRRHSVFDSFEGIFRQNASVGSQQLHGALRLRQAHEKNFLYVFLKIKSYICSSNIIFSAFHVFHVLHSQ